MNVFLLGATMLLMHKNSQMQMCFQNYADLSSIFDGLLYIKDNLLETYPNITY